MNSKHLSVTLSAACLVAVAGLVAAGPLNPPAGPVAGTYKTLSEVEPRTAISASNTPGDATNVYIITQPGSYYLTGNVAVAAGKNGIKVAASNVTIDLSGFAITGSAGSVDGIYNIGGTQQIHVHDGSVVTMGARGIDLGYQLGMIVRNATVRGCGDTGIYVASGSVVDSCVAQECGSTGIQAGAHCVVRDCSARNNAHYGYYLNSGTAADNCVAGYNTQLGFFTLMDCSLRGCVADTNFGDGFNTQGGSSFVACTATSNSGDGFHAPYATMIRECFAHDNADDGIEVGERCSVVGNTCDFNGAAASGGGVYITGAANRVEDNHVNSNRYGIYAVGLDNFIVKNTARANVTSNFNIVAGNEAAATIANPGLNNFATMTPWSNVAY